MVQEMQTRGLSDPVYVQGQGSVRLSLSGRSRVPEDVTARMPRGALDTLNLLRGAGEPLGTGEVVDLARLSRPVVIKQLAAHRTEGLVAWSGKSATDPRATWVAVD